MKNVSKNYLHKMVSNIIITLGDYNFRMIRLVILCYNHVFFSELWDMRSSYLSVNYQLVYDH